MRFMRSMMLLTLMCAVFVSLASAQTPAPGGRGGGRGGQRGATGGTGATAAPAQRGGGGGGGRGGGAPGAQLSVMTTGWSDGGIIPARYTQSGPEISPQIQWQNVPSGTESFVITFTDADSMVNGSTDGLLHWMVWNIPATMGALQQALPGGFELENSTSATPGQPATPTPGTCANCRGIRQMSVSGDRYRGPGAPAAGPIHHYIIQLYALDTMLDAKVPPQGNQDANPATQQIRTQIMEAMVGHIRGKAAYVGLFHRSQ